MTGRQLRSAIAADLGVEAHALDGGEVRSHIDTILLEHFEAPPSAALGSAKKAAAKRPAKRAPVRRSASAEEASVVRLKGYIAKCGVRRIWKRELDGLTPREALAKLSDTLRSLGVEGRPTLEKCKAVKRRREFEEEMSAIDTTNVLALRLRKRTAPTNYCVSGLDSDDESVDEGVDESVDDNADDSVDSNADDGNADDSEALSDSAPVRRPKRSMQALSESSEGDC